jgi:hypothetical protein
MTDDAGKEPYPDDIDETSTGWPDDDEELEWSQNPPEEHMEPYPDDVDKNKRQL